MEISHYTAFQIFIYYSQMCIHNLAVLNFQNYVSKLDSIIKSSEQIYLTYNVKDKIKNFFFLNKLSLLQSSTTISHINTIEKSKRLVY